MNYFADTPTGAWVEFLLHEGIAGPEDLVGVRRSLWAVELPEGRYASPQLPPVQTEGGPVELRRMSGRGKTPAGSRRKADADAISGAGAWWRPRLAEPWRWNRTENIRRLLSPERNT